MPEHRSRKAEDGAPTPWRVPVAVEDIVETGQHFALVAGADVRAAIARMAGLRDLPRLEAEFNVTRQGAAGLHVIGRVSATVGQACVVSLEPLVNEIEEEIDLVFMPRPAAARQAGETATEDKPREFHWDDPEPLIDGVVDLGALATEFLILGLDPYPRKPGAVFEPPRDVQPEDSPFTALAGWTKGRNSR